MPTDAPTLQRSKAQGAKESRVISEAVSRVAANWKLTNEELGRILGISAASVSRLRSGTFELDRGEKSFELAQYLVRVFRSLDSIMGSDDSASISWLKAHNLDLDARPSDLMRSIGGLIHVADYVDGFRARV